MKIKRVKVFCTTENKECLHLLDPAASIPNYCPTDPAHAIDETKTLVMDIGDEEFQLDSDKAQIVRTKAAPLGWTYQAHCMEIETASGALEAKKPDGTEHGFCTVSRKKADGTATTVEGEAVETIVDFMPTHDYEIIGGEMRCRAEIPAEQNCRLWVIAVPDYPAVAGGSKLMVSNMNMAYIGVGGLIKVDGRASKNLKYNNPAPGTNKLRFHFKHGAGEKVKVQIMIELFKA